MHLYICFFIFIVYLFLFSNIRSLLYPPVQAVLSYSLPPPPPFFFLSWTEEPVKAGTCARDRRALQQLALNVHVKHTDLTLTWHPD